MPPVTQNTNTDPSTNPHPTELGQEMDPKVVTGLGQVPVEQTVEPIGNMEDVAAVFGTDEHPATQEEVQHATEPQGESTEDWL
ncbi:MAG TPA: hypothetical protein VHT70_03055 [Candidatus Saccharimonadales bacterium]|nr:hypothetical protein [Candidatus Saccharimonadales bacterium]